MSVHGLSEMAATLRLELVERDQDGGSPCWVVAGRSFLQGYVYILRNGYRAYAHRHALEAALGRRLGPTEIAGHRCHDRAAHAGLCAGGHCVHRRCVNPGHLEAQTPAENTASSPLTNGHKAFCPRGHRYGGDNAYLQSGRCATCRLTYWRDRRRAGAGA